MQAGSEEMKQMWMVVKMMIDYPQTWEEEDMTGYLTEGMAVQVFAAVE